MLSTPTKELNSGICHQSPSPAPMSSILIKSWPRNTKNTLQRAPCTSLYNICLVDHIQSSPTLKSLSSLCPLLFHSQPLCLWLSLEPSLSQLAFPLPIPSPCSLSLLIACCLPETASVIQAFQLRVPGLSFSRAVTLLISTFSCVYFTTAFKQLYKYWCISDLGNIKIKG